MEKQEALMVIDDAIDYLMDSPLGNPRENAVIKNLEKLRAYINTSPWLQRISPPVK